MSVANNNASAVRIACNSDFAGPEPAPMPQPVVRTVLVHITGTPASMDSLGGGAACWTLSEQQAVKIFSPSRDLSYEDALRKIKNVLLQRVTLLGYKSTCDTVAALHLEGIPGSEFTQTGEEHHFSIMGKGENNIPQDLFQSTGDTAVGLNWLQQNPDFNPNNMRDEKTVMRLGDSGYYFVHQIHPVIAHLQDKKNQDQMAMLVAPRTKVNSVCCCGRVHVWWRACYPCVTTTTARVPAGLVPRRRRHV